MRERASENEKKGEEKVTHSDPFPWDLLSTCGVRDFFSCAPRYIKVLAYVPYFFIVLLLF